MKKYYFTFGSWKKFPYHNGYLIVKASNIQEAIKKYRNKYPDIHKNTLNCSFYYSEEEWDDNNTGICHEIIE